MNRRTLLWGAAAVGLLPAAAAARREARRFRAPNLDIEMTIEYLDRYSSSGFWFQRGASGAQFCLSGGGEENRRCMGGFRGSLAIVQYRIRPGPQVAEPAAALEERVRTLDRDARLRDRPPFERTIELTKGVASDLQAFGYEPAGMEEDPMFRIDSPWYLFRQDLFLEPRHMPFLTIFWKHALASIRALDIIPARGTSLVGG